MGRAVPPATLARVLLADDAAREARPASGSAVLRTLPEVAETRLANGLRVVVAKSSDVPLVTLKLVIDGCDAADPSCQAGRGAIASAPGLQGAWSSCADDPSPAHSTAEEDR